MSHLNVDFFCAKDISDIMDDPIITVTVPLDIPYVSRLLKAIEKDHTIEGQVEKITQLLSYTLKFPNFFRQHTDIAYYLRRNVIDQDKSINDAVAVGLIDFDTGSHIITLLQKVKSMTDFLADFDFGDIELNENIGSPIAIDHDPIILYDHRYESEEEEIED